MHASPSPIAAVYGAGGFFGIGYGLGVAHGLVERGVPLVGAPAVGTSAGAWVAAALELGVPFDAFAALTPPRVPDYRPGLLRGLAADLFGERRAPSTLTVAVAFGRRPRRVLLAGAAAPAADLVAASSAVPGVFAPGTVNGSRYVDGGLRSLASVDCAQPARRLVVVAPVAGLALPPAGRVATVLLRREIGRWQRANPDSTVELFVPGGDAGRLVRTPLDVFDMRRAIEAYWMGREQAHRHADRVPGATSPAAGSRPAAA